MPASQHSLLATAGAAGITSLSTSAPAGPPKDPAVDHTVAELVRLSEEANNALMQGDVDRYRALVPLSDDFTLMSPFGGTPSRSARLTDEEWAAIGRFFRNGMLKQELVQAYGSADMVVLVVMEHARHVEVGGLPAQDWSLRVTLVYRREGTKWRLTHRHADSLARGITLEQAAALARG
ncbi:nuclear transport factor 2 family protein [Mesorhizobium sp. CGMCC 1.15528]|uniref:Nuclear transport factor 2 family protein n=1 Tax=Mesorhizobium zhangyense TaxID=1776730 RepID=A0A7C9RBP1_9HYPH|nr:nuclear transport factor 2 family protein [Mesorhizobium zhangyense]NGN45121.1 nuclear transport factor 2 family protein [Mesorhizobium zhangyense]